MLILASKYYLVPSPYHGATTILFCKGMMSLISTPANQLNKCCRVVSCFYLLRLWSRQSLLQGYSSPQVSTVMMGLNIFSRLLPDNKQH